MISRSSGDATDRAMRGRFSAASEVFFCWSFRLPSSPLSSPLALALSPSLTSLFFFHSSPPHTHNNAAGGSTEPHKVVGLRAALDLHGDGIVPFQNKYRKVSFFLTFF